MSSNNFIIGIRVLAVAHLTVSISMIALNAFYPDENQKKVSDLNIAAWSISATVCIVIIILAYLLKI